MIGELSLTSERTRIRAWRRGDYEAMDRWPPFSDPMSLIWNLPQGLSAGGRGWDVPDVRRAYAVEDREGRLVGRISLREIDRGRGSARLGISFGPPFVGRGLGTEALSCFLEAYFGPLEFRLMVLDVAATNVRAVRSYEKLGFSITGSHWREAGEQITSKLRGRVPAELEHLVRWGRRGMWIEFYDMELSSATWQSYARARRA